MSRRSARPRKYQAMVEYHVELCPKQRKKIYASQKEARTTLNALKAKRGKEAAKRIYKCDHCSGWHMTSISDELQDEIEEMRKNRPSLLFEAKWIETINVNNSKNKENETEHENDD